MNVFPRWSGDGQSLVYSARNSPGIRETRRVWLSGQAPEKLPVACEDLLKDVASDGRLACYNSAEDVLEVFHPETKKTETLEGIHGRLPRWSRDARRIAYVVSSSAQNDLAAGLWIYNFQEKARQVFRGWVAWYAWLGNDELFLAEGKPDLKASLWRIRLDGTSPQRVPGTLPMIFVYTNWVPMLRFDAHPDARRIATETARVRQANIGIIESVR
jgi:hypothetical protein